MKYMLQLNCVNFLGTGISLESIGRSNLNINLKEDLEHLAAMMVTLITI